MAKGTSPTQRTLDRLRKDGWVCQSVEKKAPMPAGQLPDRTGRVRMAFFLTTTQDLFGCIDIVACREGEIVGIQTTGGSNHAARRHKILDEPRMRTWLASGAKLQIWTWRQVVAYRADGTKAKLPRWEARIEEMTLADFGPCVAGPDTAATRARKTADVAAQRTSGGILSGGAGS